MKPHKQLLHEIALTLVPGIGDVLIRHLISYCGNAEEVFRQSKNKLLRIPGIGEKVASAIHSFKSFQRAEEEIIFIEKHQVQSIFYTDKDYPSRLRHFADAPVMIYMLGHTDLNNPKIVGIVGTRKATEYGKAFTAELVNALKPTGALIISGLAFGIDISAHKAALENGLPTIGVTGHGLDRIYPYQHKSTAKQMLEQGGLLTEFMSESLPDRENFPKRNRIVAGLCDVLVIAESSMKGGAMITADIAHSYDKEIMALPGRAGDEFSEGTNHLIKTNKAAMITRARDLFEWMNWDIEIPAKELQQKITFHFSVEEAKVVSYLQQRTKAAIDDIALSLQVDPGTLSLTLLDLEFRGSIRSLPGKCFELV